MEGGCGLFTGGEMDKYGDNVLKVDDTDEGSYKCFGQGGKDGMNGVVVMLRMS